MVDEETSKLLTINIQRGLYSFIRLPFRCKVTPSIFQKIMDSMLAELDFAMAYLDDILIKSETFKKLGNFVSNSVWINANFRC